MVVKLAKPSDVAGFVVTDPKGRTVHRESFPSGHLPANTLAARMNRHEAKLARTYGAGFSVEAGLFNSAAAFDHFFPPENTTPLGPHALPDPTHIPVAAQLVRRGVPARVVAWVEADLRVDENRTQLIEQVAKRFAPQQRDRILSALRLAETAHAGQTQIDLPDVPYTNHVINCARLVSSAGGSADAIAAALLHDAVEDSDVTPDQIEDLCGSAVARIVERLTRGTESRAAYLEHCQHLEGDALLVKGADRVHNLLRSFTREDTDAAFAYLDETRRTFDALFANRAELATLRPLYAELAAALTAATKPPAR